MNLHDNRLAFGYTTSDNDEFELQAILDFDNEVIDLYANGHKFDEVNIFEYVGDLEEQASLKESIINENYSHDDLDTFVQLVYSKFYDLAVIETETSALFQNEEMIFYKGETHDLEYKGIEDIFLELDKEGIIKINDEHENYLNEIKENLEGLKKPSSEIDFSEEGLKKYYNHFSPYDWYNSEEVKDFEEWKEWFYNQSMELHIYNLMCMIEEMESERKK